MAIIYKFTLNEMETIKEKLTNQELKKQLLKKGYYVQKVGIQNEPDYLIISVHEPQNEIKTN